MRGEEVQARAGAAVEAAEPFEQRAVVDAVIGETERDRADFAHRVGDRQQVVAAHHRLAPLAQGGNLVVGADDLRRSEEHTSELQSLMRISYAVFCFKHTTDSTYTRQAHNSTT